MNKIMLVGRLTKDPETRYSQGAEAIAVCRFGLAVNRRFKREGEPEADFINCVAFGKTAEFIQKYFTKGMAIGLSGRLQTRTWEDRQGQKRVITEAIAEEAEFVERKQNTQAAQAQQRQPQSGYNAIYAQEDTTPDDALPF